MSSDRVVWMGLALLLLPSAHPASAANPCAAGGSPVPVEGGIGGTGRQPGPGDDGIGGTGITAESDTGVIGTITGFASICVGGVEVHYSAETPTRIDGDRATPSDLAVGQVVEVVAARQGDALAAREIAVQHVVSGPVAAIDPVARTITVLNQIVQLPASAGDETTGAAFSRDTFVQVSGMRRADGTVVASRIATIAPRAVVQLVGVFEWVASGDATVAGTPIASDGVPTAPTGEEVRVTGRWDGHRIVAAAVDALPRVPFDGRVAHVAVEGFAHKSRTGGLLVGAFSARTGLSQSAEGVPAGERVRIEGVVRDRQLVIERYQMVPDLPPRPSRPDGPDGARGGSDSRPPSMHDHGGRDGAQGHPPDVHPFEPPEFGGRPRGGGGPPCPDRPTAPCRPPHIERPQGRRF